ncbi:gametogenetin-binding protein 2-like [Melitaea cinxia]|uniref:gametogenetin-binding protein 2-like n=1 Tax=Melitaea cinxia TaxID=113334 RepID=UPI001E26F11B|nr:gametogenetin-binding protein 2-like [Melitaea cinxia]
MAKLVDIYNCEKEPVIKRKQLPLTIYENLTMIMDISTMGLIFDSPQVKGREYDEFIRKYRTLTTDELKSALRVDASDIFNVLNQSIPCVGCRRSVERLFYQLCKSGHPTLDPLILTQDEIMTIREDKITNPQSLATLLNGHSTGLECLILSQPRWKKSQRCTLHSLEAGTARGWGSSGCGWGWGAWGWGGRTAWCAAWDAMRTSAREHVTLVHFNTLHDTLHNYLRKHRFCADCKTKVLRAYQLLVEEKEPQKEKGYVGALYGGIKRCLLDKHLHLQAKTDYIAHLIARAEPELFGNHRERHAKTLEIAQEEVLICLGICIYERLQRISLRLREEENTCQILAAVGVEALYRKFETAVELKRGVSKLQLLYDEITQEELTRQQRKEQKKLKRRKKKERQAVENKCKEADSEEPEEKCQCEECLLEERDTPTDLLSPREYSQCYDSVQSNGDSCHSCQEDFTKLCSPKKLVKKLNKNGKLSPNEHSQDCGYSSGNNGGCCETMSGSSSLMSSPEGSEVACSEGFCNHERGDCLDLTKNDKTSCTGFTLSLQDMLDTCSSDEEQDTSYIPIEDVLEFKSRRNITEKRQELRQNLRQKFAQLCVNTPPLQSVMLKQGENHA